MALSSLISYQRAKAESLGLDAKGGLMERAERIVLLCIGLLFEPLLVPVLWVMLVLTAITAVQRFVKVWRQAQVAPVTAARIEMRRSRRQTRRVARQRAAAHPRAAAPHLTVAGRRRRRRTPVPAPDRRGDRRRLPHRRAARPHAAGVRRRRSGHADRRSAPASPTPSGGR